ncbi:DUF5677 domain-containing protein [Chryseobacterium sp. MEBOG06]|uniref:DUF5677 domain-containing protein n=1 Tax=Chryseobacterium sp. MEBOG06 TaxID=2879938 RepID=UPI001F2C373E|nr:DUF5677 domain-containing protein [Chryseobacterium sp. MEBOG06]UKB83344.1 DUF5677 domain-containing protein [Chryseobacterium sp. MEBOG06]
MKDYETTSPFEMFERLTKIGASISYKFDGILEKDKRKNKSTYYLAKVLNTNMTILSLINGSFNGIENYSDSLDLSTIYSLLRNQIETCNIYWYLIDDYSTNENLDLKLTIFEYHDTLSSQIIYNSLFYTEENEEYFKEKEEKQLIEIKNNPNFELLDNNTKKQILSGNKSTIDTQFEIITKRAIDLKIFKAYYKIFSTHIHSSPTAIKNLTSSKINKDHEEFEIMFMFISLNYISLFIADMILSIVKLWNLNDLNKDDEQLLKFLRKQL